MKWSPVRFRLRYVGLAAVAVVLAWFVVGRLWPRPLAGPGELLPPTGPLLVGRTSYHWVDDARSCQMPTNVRNVRSWCTSGIPRNLAGRCDCILYSRIRDGPGRSRADALRDAAGDSYEGLSTARTHAVADAADKSRYCQIPRAAVDSRAEIQLSGLHDARRGPGESRLRRGRDRSSRDGIRRGFSGRAGHAVQRAVMDKAHPRGISRFRSPARAMVRRRSGVRARPVGAA